MIKDPVCGMVVDPRTAAAQAVYGGQRYYFCCPGCRTVFERDPERYLSTAELAERLDYAAYLVQSAGYIEVSRQLIDWSERLHEPCEGRSSARPSAAEQAWPCESELWLG
jgi:YHS domain-containing protein